MFVGHIENISPEFAVVSVVIFFYKYIFMLQCSETSSAAFWNLVVSLLRRYVPLFLSYNLSSIFAKGVFPVFIMHNPSFPIVICSSTPQSRFGVKISLENITHLFLFLCQFPFPWFKSKICPPPLFLFYWTIMGESLSKLVYGQII